MTRNREGLTFAEWVRAATFGGTHAIDDATALRAWEAGEDPTEYASREGTEHERHD